MGDCAYLTRQNALGHPEQMCPRLRILRRACGQPTASCDDRWPDVSQRATLHDRRLMCGIAGTTRRQGVPAVAAMCDAMVHRGPDDSGIHHDDASRITIGARRLSIIDVQGGHQPLSTPDERVWAVLNGEIYNHRRLQRALRASGHDLRTRTDTEVLVHLYEEYGDALVHALEGMFAFAIVDTRRQRVLLGRDRFGEKPLFYRLRGGELTFASELSALRAGEGSDWDVNPLAIHHVVRLGYVPGPASAINGVLQLPPAHTLAWERGRGAMPAQRYWSLPSMPARPSMARAELLDELERSLRDSVRERLISDVPIGVLLSGGLDSSLVAALATRVSPTRVRTFTVGYGGGRFDESGQARNVATRLGSEHVEVVLDETDVALRAPAVLAALDQPLADQALVAMHCVAEQARNYVTVAVGGEGADELFAGYPRYRWLARSDLVHHLLPTSASNAIASAGAHLPLPGRLRRLPLVASTAPLLERHLAWTGAVSAETAAALYGARLRDLAMAPLNTRIDAGLSTSAALMALDIGQWLPDDVLAKADRASMQVSLELRTPYLSREVAELAAAVPPTQHLGQGGKSLLRVLMRRLAPELGPSRPKAAFRVPADEWLRGPLYPALRAQLRNGAAVNEGWFDRSTLARLVGEHLARRHDHSSTLWRVLAVGLWLDALRNARAG